MKRLDPKTTLLLIVDVQEKLARAMPAEALARLTKNATTLVAAAHRLDARVLVTEQYPQGLGPTIPELGAAIAPLAVTPIAKTHFDALSDDAIQKIAFLRRPEAAVIIGMESHVCVFQTARSFVDRGVSTYVVSDAVCSRTEENRLSGLHLIERAGAVVTNTESVVFDWLEHAGTDEFRELSKLIR